MSFADKLRLGVPRSDPFIRWLNVAALALLLAAGACTSTITPDRVTSEAASFDGNEQNSGVIAATPAGYIVTPHFVARYNALAKIYGDRFQPALLPDAGVTALLSNPPQLVIDREHMVKFLEMNAWNKMGKTP